MIPQLSKTYSITFAKKWVSFFFLGSKLFLCDASCWAQAKKKIDLRRFCILEAEIWLVCKTPVKPRDPAIEPVGTVDGRNPANQLSLVVYPIFDRVLTSQVVQDFFHQQYFLRKSWPPTLSKDEIEHPRRKKNQPQENYSFLDKWFLKSFHSK